MKAKSAIRLGTVCLTAALLLLLAAAVTRRERKWNFTAVPLAPHQRFERFGQQARPAPQKSITTDTCALRPGCVQPSLVVDEAARP